MLLVSLFVLRPRKRQERWDQGARMYTNEVNDTSCYENSTDQYETTNCLSQQPPGHRQSSGLDHIYVDMDFGSGMQRTSRESQMYTEPNDIHVVSENAGPHVKDKTVK